MCDSAFVIGESKFESSRVISSTGIFVFMLSSSAVHHLLFSFCIVLTMLLVFCESIHSPWKNFCSAIFDFGFLVTQSTFVERIFCLFPL